MRTSTRPVLAVAALAATVSVLSGCALTPKPVSTAGRSDITAAVPSAESTPSASPTQTSSPSASPTSSASASSSPTATPSASAASASASAAAVAKAKASAAAVASAQASASAAATPSDAPWVSMKDAASGVTFRFPRTVKPTVVKASDGSQTRRYQTILVDGTATGVAVADSARTLGSNQLKQVAVAQGKQMGGGSGKATLEEARPFGSGKRYGLDARVTVTGGKVAVLYRVRLAQDGKHLVMALTLLGRRGSIDAAAQRRVSAVQSQLAGGLRLP